VLLLKLKKEELYPIFKRKAEAWRYKNTRKDRRKAEDKYFAKCAWI